MMSYFSNLCPTELISFPDRRKEKLLEHGLNMFLSEYDALAKVIQQHPDRQETLRSVTLHCCALDCGNCGAIIAVLV